MIIRSRIVLPITGPPIENGQITVRHGRIQSVEARPTRETVRGRRSTIDLGDQILLPGLVNAHCHLDCTGLAGQTACEDGFVGWLGRMVVLRQQQSPTTVQHAWRRGAAMLEECGVTSVANIESSPALVHALWPTTPLRIISFLEITGVLARSTPASLLAACERTGRSLGQHAAKRWGLSPHALYSTMPETLRRCRILAQKRRLQLTMHVAESAAEAAFCQLGKGPLARWLTPLRGPGTAAHRCSPVGRLAKLRLLGPRFSAVHANYLERGDAELLARSGSSVVHCPRSHAFFGHRRFPFRQLHTHGVNIALGTDSLASIRTPRGEKPRLDMFAEMRTLVEHSRDISPREALRMATVNGAQALGLAGRAGCFQPGVYADLIAFPFSGPRRSVYSAALQFTGTIETSMIAGRWLRGPVTE